MEINRLPKENTRIKKNFGDNAVWERSSITSAGFVQTWTPHPPLHQQNQHRVRPPTPYIADVILEPKLVGLSSSQVVKWAIFSKETTIDNPHNVVSSDLNAKSYCIHLYILRRESE